ncbi:hypothetical protein DWW31_14150 [Clostridium sp. AF15-17LB]|nr:hypothetical protein DWW31_14150 [Clostridium sp. AF15-17LB]
MPETKEMQKRLRGWKRQNKNHKRPGTIWTIIILLIILMTCLTIVFSQVILPTLYSLWII